MSDVARKPLVPLRRSLILAAFGIALAALGTFFASVYLFVYIPVTQDLARAQLGQASQQVEARIATLVRRVEAVARLNHDWGARGLFDVDDVERFNDLMRPVLDRGPDLSSVVAAHESGRELLLMRLPGDRWSNRLTDPDAWGKQARFLTWNARWELESDETQEFDYDARRRPWFQGGMTLASDEDIHWTEPFIFRSSLEPGLSAVVRWTAPDGSRFAMTSDIKLIDLSRHTRDIVAGRSGFVAVLTGDGRLLGLPRDARFGTDEAIKGAVLKAPAELGVTPLAEGFDRWRKGGARDGELLRFAVGGTTWVAIFESTRLGAQTLWIATLAPQADFFPASAAEALIIAALAAGTLLLAGVLATQLARRVVRPLELLAAESARIGRLDLERPVDVRSPWLELDALAQAQESMRLELLEATRRLAEAKDSLEAKVEERTRELAEAKDAADAATRAKAEFLANMSHEIRTPMNAIIGMAQLAVRAGLPPRQHDCMLKIQRAGRHLLGIINDVLDASKMEAGKLTLERSEFAVGEVMDNVARMVDENAAAKGLELIFDVDRAIPERLVGDPLRLGQVLLNYASNAVKFTEHGEVVVAVRLLEETPSDVLIELSVRDTGVGIPPEQIGSLFEPFQQADASTTRRFGGSGLGLSIAKRLAEMLGGTVGVDSELGRGSTFWFTARLGKGARAPRAEPPPLKGGRALVVDDVRQARTVLADLLSSLSFTVRSVDCGAAALAEFEAAIAEGRPYDIVFLDWLMPGMDGLETARHIRRLGASAQAQPRIVLVTAYAREEAFQGAEAVGVDTLLTKPITASLLHDTMMRLFVAPESKRAAPAAAGEAPSGRLRLPESLSSARILLAEDNELNQEVALALLAEGGVSVDVAPNGVVAVEKVRSGEYDAVLMDMQMPLMDGLAAARAIRALPGRDRVPIIAITANVLPQDRERCRAAGMNDHIAKPIERDALWQTLLRWIPTSCGGATPAPTASTPPAAAVPLDVPGLDAAGALRRLGGMAEVYMTVLRMFVSGQAGAHDEIRAALAAGEHDVAVRRAHTLKGAAGTAGAGGIERAAAAVEAALSRGAPAIDVDRLLQALASQLQEIIEQLKLRLPA